MKNTVKLTTIKSLANKKSFTRKEMQFAVFSAQGKKGKEANTYRQGYYCVAFQEWVYEGLIERLSHGVYRVTSDGMKYVDNPNYISEIRTKLELKRVTHKLDWYIKMYHDAKVESKSLRQELERIKDAINVLKNV